MDQTWRVRSVLKFGACRPRSTKGAALPSLREPPDEVAQLYMHLRSGTSSRPVRELKGFQRVSLEPGETQSLSFTLGPDELRYWNAAARDWVQDAATFDVWVGGDSTAELHATFEVTQP